MEYTPHSLCSSVAKLERRQLRAMDAVRMKVGSDDSISKNELAVAIQSVHGHHLSEYNDFMYTFIL